MVEELIRESNLPNWATLALFMAISFLAGFVLEWISILLIFIPVFIPVITHMGYDPVLVLRVVPDHYSNQLPYAANGTCDFLLERH